MANAFAQASEIEQLAEADLLPYMERTWPDCTYYPTRHHRIIQKVCGDWLVKRRGRVKYIELKAELNATGNLFIETWSNKARRTFGWFHYCQADWLWYYFVDDKHLYIFAMQELREWARSDLFKYREVPQRKYEQRNDTWGHLVPIAVLQESLPSFRGPINPCGDTPT